MSTEEVLKEIDRKLEEVPIIEAATVGYRCEDIDELIDYMIAYIKKLDFIVKESK